jgi:hypothetical protein
MNSSPTLLGVGGWGVGGWVAPNHTTSQKLCYSINNTHFTGKHMLNRGEYTVQRPNFKLLRNSGIDSWVLGSLKVKKSGSVQYSSLVISLPVFPPHHSLPGIFTYHLSIFSSSLSHVFPSVIFFLYRLSTCLLSCISLSVFLPFIIYLYLLFSILSLHLVSPLQALPYLPLILY